MATAILALEHGEPLDMAVYCEVMFDSEISGEVPEHREFIYNRMIPYLESNGVPVQVVSGSKTYMDCFYHEIKKPRKNHAHKGKRCGFPMGDKCVINSACKTGPMKKWLNSNFPENIQYIGIAADEPKRLERMKAAGNISLLAKYGYTAAMAAVLCKERGLYSPVYEYSARNGCWFCPNCRMRQFAELKRRHPDLWGKLLALGKVENLVTYSFKYGMTVEQVDREISMQAMQMRLADL